MIAQANTSKEKSNYIPDEAIENSAEQHAPSPVEKGGKPPVDQYTDEKISPSAPTNEEVKAGAIDDNVMPG